MALYRLRERLFLGSCVVVEGSASCLAKKGEWRRKHIGVPGAGPSRTGERPELSPGG